jgi:hypothetical protein
MLRIKNDRLKLLKTLQSHVKVSLDNADVNPNLELDVAELIIVLREKKTVKMLKSVKKELDIWIKEMEFERKQSK